MDYSKLSGNRVLVGYMVGGIRATAWQTTGANPTYPVVKISAPEHSASGPRP